MTREQFIARLHLLGYENAHTNKKYINWYLPGGARSVWYLHNDSVHFPNVSIKRKRVTLQKNGVTTKCRSFAKAIKKIQEHIP